jgi:hypothetical protein
MASGTGIRLADRDAVGLKPGSRSTRECTRLDAGAVRLRQR